MILGNLKVQGQDSLILKNISPENFFGSWLNTSDKSKDTLTFTRNNDTMIPIGERINIEEKGELLYTYNGGCIYDQKVLHGNWVHNKGLNTFETTFPISESTKFKLEKVTRSEMILIKIK